MKKIILIFFIVMLAAPVFSATWCQWSGTQGVDCKTDNNGIFQLPNGVYVAQKDFNAYGYYELVTTQPVLNINQVRDTEVWGFSSNQITKTWTVKDLTTEEIDAREAVAMPLSEYYLWKIMVLKGVITIQEIQDNLPQKLKDAYLARDRILNP